MKIRIGKFVLPLLAVGMLVFAIIHVVRAQQTPPRPEPPVEPARTPFGSTVAGAGIAEAMTENIAIGTPLPGVVLEVYVPVEQVGKRVKKGDPLFLVDNRQLKAQLKVNEANVSASEAQLAKLQAQPRPEEVPAYEAKLKAAKANLSMVEDQYRRSQRLVNSPALSEEDYRRQRFATDVAQWQVAQANADFELEKAGAWKKDIDIAKASVDQARAQAEQTKVDLDRCIVRATVDGDVLQVNVRPGEYVGTPPNQALVVLGNIHKLYVRVDIDEHDIPRFRKGAPARASLRGNPQLSYPLTFVRVEPYVIPKKSLTGDNTERVDTRVLQVIYSLNVPDDKPIYVGQQLDVFIDVGKPKTEAESPSRALTKE